MSAGPSGRLRSMMAVLAVAGCAKPVVPSLPLEVEPSGCAALGPQGCERGPEGVVRLRVLAPVGAGLEVRLDGQVVQATASQVGDARLLVVPVTAASKSLSLSASAGEAKATWSLALVSAPASAAIDAAKTLQAKGALVDAATGLSAALPTLVGVEAGRARSLLARLQLGQGQHELAAATFGEAIAAHQAAGRLTEASDDAFALAYCVMQYGQRFDVARTALERAAQWVQGFPDGQARLPYYQGVLASKTGDVRGALAAYRLAIVRADGLGLVRLARNARQELAEVERVLGRWKHARALLEEARARLEASAKPCDRADLATNLAWVELSARESRLAAAEATVVPETLLAEALAATHNGCPDPHRQANAHVNLALAALQRGDANAAREALAAARAVQQAPTSPVAQFWLDVEGRSWLLSGQLKPALEVYATLAQLAVGSASPEARWRAAMGVARAQLRAGRPDHSSRAYAEAETILGELPALPLLEGRDTFLGEHEQSAREWVDLLVSQGQPAKALEVARTARARALRALERGDRLARLSAAERAGWEQALGAFRREREALDAEARDDWKRPAKELASVVAARRVKEAQLRTSMDAAFAVLGAKSNGAALRAPTAGELWLAYFPARDGWVGFAATDSRVEAARLGAVDVTAAPEVLATTLLAPFEKALTSARSVRVLAYGALRGVDLHALPWKGQPLLASLPVAYALDVPHASEAAKDAAVLVVADPTGDLPAAVGEGESVRTAWASRSAVTVLAQKNAGRAQVLEALPKATLFHYAGHGRSGGEGGWDHTLPLAGGAELGVVDVLAMPKVPQAVVLAGCETGRTATDSPLESLGLGHAFVLAGSGAVVASTRPVSDGLAAKFGVALHGAGDGDVAVGARAAQLAVLQSQPELDWSAFRVLVP